MVSSTQEAEKQLEEQKCSDLWTTVGASLYALSQLLIEHSDEAGAVEPCYCHFDPAQTLDRQR